MECALAFRTLAEQIGWPDDPLKLQFRRRLSPELQTEFACRDEGKTLDQLLDLAIRFNNMICSRKPSRGSTFRSLSPSVVPEQEAMPVGHACISPEERDCRYRQHLCLYCGQACHVKISCPTRPNQHTFSAVSQSFNSSRCVKVPVKLAFNDGVIETMALIDSGAAGNCIDADFAKSQDLPLIRCKSPLAVAALDRRPLGAGQVPMTSAYPPASCIQKSLVSSSYKLPTIQLFLDSPGFNYTSPRSHGRRVKSLTGHPSVSHSVFRFWNHC